MKMRKNIISLAILAAFGSVAKSDDGYDESLGMLKMIIMTPPALVHYTSIDDWNLLRQCF